MPLSRRLIVCLLALATGLRGALAEENDAAGSGIRAGQPRLFVPQERLAAIAARAVGKLSALYYGKVKKDCDEAFDERRLEFTCGSPRILLARMLALLLCHRLEKAPPYKDRVVALVDRLVRTGPGPTKRDARIRLQALSLAHDWLYEDLDVETRSRWRSEILTRYAALDGALETDTEFVSGHSHFTTSSLLLAAIATHDGSAADEARLTRALGHWARYFEVASAIGVDGGQHLGWRYGRSYATRVAWTAEAIATATSADVFGANREWLGQLGYHFVYGLRPDDTFLRVGDTHRRVVLNLDEDLLGVAILASRYRDHHLAGLAWHAIEGCQRSESLGHPAEYVYALLFLDPEIPPSGPESLPPVRAFRQAGNYVLRSGWGADDTLVLFRAMPWYHFNHEHRDFSSFQIYHRGALAIGGGAYLAGDDVTDYGGPHLVNYAWRTVAQNTITVLDPGERFCNPTGPGSARCEGEDRWANDGGQRIRSTRDADLPVPHFQPRDARDLADPRFAQGEVLVFEDRPELTYIHADATKAYHPRKLTRFARHFFFLKRVAGWPQPVVVILDDVEAVDAGHKKTWNLHSVAAPELRGKTAVFTNTTRVRLAGDVRPGRNDPWQAYSGQLHCVTLLPEDARLEYIGGEGREFWVDGKNYPAETREVDRVIEPGDGRLEVTPGAARAADLFLHALYPGTAGDARQPPAARALEVEGALAAAAIGDHIIVVARAASLAPIRYRVAGTGPRLHVIVGLPGDSELSLGASPDAAKQRTSRGGLIVQPSSVEGELEWRVARP